MKAPKLFLVILLLLASFAVAYTTVSYFNAKQNEKALFNEKPKKISNKSSAFDSKIKANDANGARNKVKPDSLKQKKSMQKKALSADFKIGIPNPHPTDDDCVFTNEYSVAQRLKQYPFSKAVKIVAVSFRFQDRRRHYSINDSVKIYDDSIHTKVPDSLLRKKPFDIQYESGLHVKDHELNYSSLIEIQNLSGKQIEILTNLIYNTTVRKRTDYADPGYTCYSPRNALVFFDKNGKVYDYLEVCFECKQYRTLSDKLLLGTFCNQKYDLLRQFLIDAGIQFGTIKTN